MNDNSSTAFSLASRLSSFITSWLPLLVVLMVAMFAHFTIETRTQIVTTESDERVKVIFAENSLGRDLSNAISDLKFLAAYVGERGFNAGVLETDAMAELFSNLLTEKVLYDQARFIGRDGREVLRINFSDGVSSRVDESFLQDKASRYYVRESLNLQKGQIYISPLDLNIELGQIERPLKPMMRFASPVFSPDGEQQGIVVLNYLGRKMLDAFSRSGPGTTEHLHLLNNEGHWLSSPGGYEEWGFMLPHGKRFENFFPQTWSALSEEDAGQIINKEGVFTFSTVRPGGSIGPIWKVVSRLPSAEQPGWPHFMSRYGVLYFLLLVTSLVIAWLLSRASLRHRLLDRQRTYEQRFRHTLENIEMAAVEIDLDAHLTFCNAFFVQLINEESVAAVLTRPVSQWLADTNDRQKLRKLLSDFNEPQHRAAARDIELNIQASDGSCHLLSCHITPMADPEKRLTGLTILAEDITGEREAEESVRQLSRVVEQSPSIVLITNNIGNIEYVNPKFCEVTGYTANEVIGQNPRFLKSGETDPAEYGDLWKRVLEGREWRGEFHNRRKNGELYWESAIISGLRSPSGEITHFVAVKEDISERKRLEQEVEQQNRELARSQSLAEMGRVASMIAHDLRNPLSSVKMGLQILPEQPESKRAELIAIGLDQVQHMETILDDILNFVRPEAVNLEWINIDNLLERTFASLQKQVDAEQIELTYHGEPGLASVPGDAYKLRQVFTNLLTNAIQAVAGMPEENRRVDVRAGMFVDSQGMAVKVTVSDNGPGIGTEVRHNVFEPFFTTKSKGTGLGLSIVRQIIEQHDGEVRLDTGQGEGCIVSVTLPTINASLSKAVS